MDYWTGQQVDEGVRKNDEQAANKMRELTNLCNQLKPRLTAELAKLEELRITVSKVPQYDRETVTRVRDYLAASDASFMD